MNGSLGSGFKVAAVVLCTIVAVRGIRGGQEYRDVAIRTPLRADQVLILGIMGGREPWNQPDRSVRRLALTLRGIDTVRLHVETIENRKRGVAVELIRKAFDRDRNGRLDVAERASAKIIIYGQSFGGAAVIKLARQLERLDIPVMLTVQIDSVGRGDRVVPPNVARAANLYQRNGWFIRGEPKIHAADPCRTEILGNFQFDYSTKKIDISRVSWMKKIFRTAHTRMEYDPEVWALVEKLILETCAHAPQAHRENTRSSGLLFSRALDVDSLAGGHGSASTARRCGSTRTPARARTRAKITRAARILPDSGAGIT